MATQPHLPPRRPLMVLTAGDPEAEKSILVHRCALPGAAKPDRCFCAERISIEEAHQFIRAAQADWVTAVRGNGQNYTYRSSIIMRATVAEVLEVVRDRRDEREAAKHAAAEKRKRAKKSTRIKEIVQSFRNCLTDQQNSEYTNAEIFNSLKNMDSSEIYLSGVEAEQRMWAATHDKKGRELESTLVQADYRKWAEAIRLKKALIKVSKHYYHVLLACSHLSLSAGLFMKDADQGKGLLAYAGDERNVAKIATHWDENERGIHKGTAEGFIAGTGGLKVGVEGGVEPIESIYNAGASSDDLGDPNDEVVPNTHPDLDDDDPNELDSDSEE
jgi:hypothetical protein